MDTYARTTITVLFVITFYLKFLKCNIVIAILDCN